ncbi:hypothetical protein Tco_0351686 [Tanacetum coccineum]
MLTEMKALCWVGPRVEKEKKKTMQELNHQIRPSQLELPKAPPSLSQKLLATVTVDLKGLGFNNIPRTRDPPPHSPEECPAYKLLKGTCMSYVNLEYNIEECYKSLTDQLDWNNPKGESINRTYTTSLNKKKAAKYDLPGIEDMVPNLWSPIKVAYDKYALLGDFPRLHLNDIEDMLLLVVQNRLFNLKGEDIMHLAAALRMFTRRIVIQNRVEDLQLGVESYQKKLNI